MDPTDEFDVVIVGSGLGGLACALFCSQAGLRPIVLEKADVIGGASCWSYGAVWIGANDLAAAAGIPDDRESVEAYLGFLGSGENCAARTQALIENSMPALRALQMAGVRLDLMDGVNDILFGKAPGAVARGRTLEPHPVAGRLLGDWRSRLRTPVGEEWRIPKSVAVRATDRPALEAAIAAATAADQLSQGTGLVAQCLLAVMQRSIPVVTGVTVEALLTSAHRVTGVRCSEGKSWYSRKAVILASGNYLSNEAWVARLDCLPDYRSWFPETHSGDGMAMAAELGASVGITRNNLMVMLGYADPSDTDNANAGVPSVRDLPRAHAMVVNRAGQRFGNECLFQELAPKLRELDLVTRQPRNLPCWMIFDSQYLARFGLAGHGPGAVPDWVMRANDLQGLAKVAGIEPLGLKAAAARFNGFATRGTDEDFGRKPAWALTPGSGAGQNASLGSIDKAPFYAVRLHPTMGGGGAGLRADSSARVLKWNDEPIAGLFAVGDVAQHNEFGAGYQAGITFASAFTFAYLAAEQLRKVR